MSQTPLNVARKAVGVFAVAALVGLAADELGLRGIMGLGNLGVWLVVFGLTGAALALAGWSRAVTAAAVLAIACLLLVSSTPLVGALTRPWVRADALQAPVDAVVVLSSDVKTDSLLDAGGTERMLTGIEVMRETHAPRIVTTQVRGSTRGVPLSTDPGQRRLLALANVDSGWRVAGAVTSTRDEAVRTAALLLPASKRIAVVTSPLHTRRACSTFEGVGFTVTCVPAREVAHVTRDPVRPYDRLAAWQAYVYERLGMLKYRWKGWIRPSSA